MRFLTRPFRRGFLREASGVTAIEFSMVGLPFFGLILVILEIGYTGFVQATLDDVAGRVSRQIMTGAVQQSSFSASEFKRLFVCPTLGALLDCSKLSVNLYPIPKSTTAANAFFTRQGHLKVPAANESTICPGGPGALAYLQLSYRTPMLSGRFIAIRAADQSLTLVGGAAIKNEPFLAARITGCVS